MKLWIKTSTGYVRVPHEILDHFKDGKIGFTHPFSGWLATSHYPKAAKFFMDYREFFYYEGTVDRGRYILGTKPD